VQADASKPDQQELINVEGRLINYLVDCITSGRERDQAYAAVLLARLLTHVSPRSAQDLPSCWSQHHRSAKGAPDVGIHGGHFGFSQRHLPLAFACQPIRLPTA
jgi:hypothetical protein